MIPRITVPIQIPKEMRVLDCISSNFFCDILNNEAIPAAAIANNGQYLAPNQAIQYITRTMLALPE